MRDFFSVLSLESAFKRKYQTSLTTLRQISANFFFFFLNFKVAYKNHVVCHLLGFAWLSVRRCLCRGKCCERNTLILCWVCRGLDTGALFCHEHPLQRAPRWGESVHCAPRTDPNSNFHSLSNHCWRDAKNAALKNIS